MKRFNSVRNGMKHKKERKKKETMSCAAIHYSKLISK